MRNPWFLLFVGLLAFAQAMLWMDSGDEERAEPLAATDTTAVPLPDPGSSEDIRAAETPGAAPVEADAMHPGDTHARSRDTTRDSTLSDIPARGMVAPTGTPKVAEATREEPTRGELIISGRVLDQNGQRLSGIEIVARPLAQRGLGSADINIETRTNSEGHYTIEGLLPGDYEVSTLEKAGYPSARKTFRAGVDSADLVLFGSTTVQLHGRVTDARGSALAEVEVSPGGRNTARVWTDADGAYRTQLTVTNPEASHTVVFRLAGYHEERVNLTARELAGAAEHRADVTLRSQGETAAVSGTLRSPRGDPVAGETVQLQSAALDTRYTATSGADGAFTMGAVEPGSDYRVTVHPRGAYENYWQQDIAIDHPGTMIEITLQPLASGRLTGRMIDVEGYPLPGFTVLLKSTKSQRRYVAVTSDDGGYFNVEDAPAGQLMFFTRSDPRFGITGITLEQGTTVTTEVVVDWGDNELLGRVADQNGAPVAGAAVHLTWQHSHRGTRSNSMRRTVTDSAGSFRFTRLGPGPHRIQVSAPGYQNVTVDHNVDGYPGEVAVTVREAPPQ
ncbi:MAG: carboxypeptidase-like regulatory domain-containing protein [Chromatiales bacterium]|nr:carboxypeptidase-like regulatory domain-containing protein [Chromatiales bacterium]